MSVFSGAMRTHCWATRPGSTGSARTTFHTWMSSCSVSYSNYFVKSVRYLECRSCPSHRIRKFNVYQGKVLELILPPQLKNQRLIIPYNNIHCEYISSSQVTLSLRCLLAMSWLQSGLGPKTTRQSPVMSGRYWSSSLPTDSLTPSKTYASYDCMSF